MDEARSFEGTLECDVVAGEPWDWFGRFSDLMDLNKGEVLTLPGKPEESGSALTRATGDPWRNGNEESGNKINDL